MRGGDSDQPRVVRALSIRFDHSDTWLFFCDRGDELAEARAEATHRDDANARAARNDSRTSPGRVARARYSTQVHALSRISYTRQSQ